MCAQEWCPLTLEDGFGDCESGIRGSCDPPNALGTEFRTSGGTYKLLTAELLIRRLEFICKDDILEMTLVAWLFFYFQLSWEFVVVLFLFICFVWRSEAN